MVNDLPGVLEQMQGRIMELTTYCGIPTLKNPLDAWVYEEILWTTRPEVIVEVGSYQGGHLLKLAHFCDVMDHGQVIGVDIDPTWQGAVLAHPRITNLMGDAIEQYPNVAELVAGRTALVIEDSSHTYENTLAVLRVYSTLVQPGHYFICEDGVVPEAARAISDFLTENDGFEPDRDRELFGITWNPSGFLRRI
jgi:cephalosporin hydroxylase